MIAVGLRDIMSGWTVADVPLRCFVEANSSSERQVVLSQFLTGFIGSLTLLSLSDMTDEAPMVWEKIRKLLCRTLFRADGGKSGQP